MADLQGIVDRLTALTVIEAGELAKMLEERWGVTARPAQVAAPAPGPVEEAPPVQTEFTVILTSAEKKVPVVRELRQIVGGIDLKTAMSLAEELPKTICEGVSRSDADAIKTKIEAAGGTVEIK